MKIRDFEKAVWNTERIRIAIRANQNMHVEEYDYRNAAPENWRISELLANRIEPLVGNHEITVVRGDGTVPSRALLLRTLRDSYRQ